MPALVLEIDDQVIARIDCGAYDTACLRVAGSLAELAFCTIELDAGMRSRDGHETNSVFLDELELSRGQVITLRYLDDATMDDVDGVWSVPRTVSDDAHEDLPVDDWFAARRSGLRLRAGYTFHIGTTSRDGHSGSTALGEHGFGFYAISDRRKPMRLCLSLATWRVDGAGCVLHRREQWQDSLRPGETATLCVDVV